MILITGGMGFIGLHVAKKLLESGEDVVLTQHQARREPDFLKPDFPKTEGGPKSGPQSVIERVDITSTFDVIEVVRRHKVRRIVHLVAPPVRGISPSEDYRINTEGLINVLEAARINDVDRVALGSSGSVYLGIPQGPYPETIPLPTESRNPVEAYKKALETMALHYASRTGMQVATMRLGHIYGPMYYSMVNLPSRLCHAAVAGRAPDYSAAPGGIPFQDDEGDFCYVKDCAKGIALIATAQSLKHTIYNVGGGVAITNGDVANAVVKAVPGFVSGLQPGRGPAYRSNPMMKLDHIQDDTGYQPDYTIDTAIADYIDWLRGNPL
jgi:UDP-glucose 4-epimerase